MKGNIKKIKKLRAESFVPEEILLEETSRDEIYLMNQLGPN